MPEDEDRFVAAWEAAKELMRRQQFDNQDPRSMSVLSIVCVGLALVCAYAAYAYMRNWREKLSVEAFRIQSPEFSTTAPSNGRFALAHLSDGWTAYKLIPGHPPTGRFAKTANKQPINKKPIITIIHGATLGSVAYAPIAHEFSEQGYTVLLYDGYGRGFSDRLRDRPVSLEVLVRQLAELLDHLGIVSTAVWGTSLGAAIAARVRSSPSRTQASTKGLRAS